MPSGSQFTNNAATTIVVAITSSATSIQVEGGTTNFFPVAESGSIDSGKWFYATLFSSDTVYEIVKVTYRQPNDPVWSIQRGREGTTAQSWPAGTKLELRITAAGLNDYRSGQPNVQHFTTVGSSTWVKPAGAKIVFIQAWGAGGGGGSGRRRAIASQATAASGGAGGSGGGYREAWIIADALASTISFNVPAGGLGGASQTVDNVNGNDGGIVDTSNNRVASALTIPNVINSAPGGNTSALTGQPLPVSGVLSYNDVSYGTYNGRGGAGFSSGSAGPSAGAYGGGGGGGGGGYGANSTTGQNGSWGAAGALMLGTSAGGVNAQGTSGNPGDRTSVPTNLNTTTQVFGGGGGGGGNTSTFTSGQASPAGMNGGKGGWPGGGGGGGAASQGANSGAGGDGGDGYIRITTFS